MEAAFAGPHKIATRMDGFDIGKIADADARRSIADVTSPDSLQEVRAFKKAAKAAAKEQ